VGCLFERSGTEEMGGEREERRGEKVLKNN